MVWHICSDIWVGIEIVVCGGDSYSGFWVGIEIVNLMWGIEVEILGWR